MEKQQEPLDPANQSLAEALELSFKILKGIMILLVILFLSTGIFSVEKNEAAIILRLGKVVGKKSERIRKPGLHWAFPFPVDEVIKFPVENEHTLTIRNFWYHSSEEQELQEKQKIRPNIPQTLDPIEHGYFLTGDENQDTNIIHCKWEVSCRISNPYDYYVHHIASDKLREGKLDDVLIKNVICKSTIKVAANFSVYEVLFTRKSEFTNSVKQLAQLELNRLNMGVNIMSLSPKIEAPRQVIKAFEAVSQAISEHDKKVEEASNYATQILSKAKAEAVLLTTTAQNYALQAEQETISDAEYFETLVPQYRKNPEIFLQRYYFRLLEKVGPKLREVFILSRDNKELEMRLNSDPKIYHMRKQESGEAEE